MKDLIAANWESPCIPYYSDHVRDVHSLLLELKLHIFKQDIVNIRLFYSAKIVKQTIFQKETRSHHFMMSIMIGPIGVDDDTVGL